MNMKRTHCLKLSLSFLFFCHLVVASVSIQGQQKEQRNDKQVAVNKNPCTASERAKFSVKCKERYFLGETPSITISIKNTGRSSQTVKEAEHQKFSLEMTGLFENASEQQKKTLVYDGSWDIPKEPIRFPLPGESHIWQSARKREPKFVKLAPSESTTLEMDLAKTFRSFLGVSKYKLAVKSEDGGTVVKEFEVYFDEEKSVAILGKMLASDSDDVSERHWAVFNLAEFSRLKLITLLEDLVKSGNEKQRDFASGILGRIKAGDFGSNL